MLKSTKTQEPTPSYINDLSNKLMCNPKLAGGKGASLAKLTLLKDINTKAGLVVTSKLYKERIDDKIKALITELEATNNHEIALREDVLRRIRETIHAIDLKDLPGQFTTLDNGKYYAVRSSATVEDGQTASFSGKFATFLYVKKSDICSKIKDVWASVFTINNVEYCEANQVSFNELHMAIVIQEMSHPYAAGTIFTDNQTIEIDAAFGLGETVVQGNKPTDKIILKSENGQIISQTTAIKNTKLIHNETQNTVIETPLLKSNRNNICLSHEQVKQLWKNTRMLQGTYNELKHGLDIEFSVDQDGKIYILQVRPVTVKSRQNIMQVDYNTSKKYYIGKGDPVSHHIDKGILYVCDTPKEAAQAIESNKSNQHKIIIVTANTTSQWETVMRQSAGIIAETGSSNCHTAIACREMNIPGITCYADAKSHLKDHDKKLVTLCGSSGRVYVGDKTSNNYKTSCTINTIYTPIETERSVSLDSHKKQATSAHMTRNINNECYIGKPMTATCPLINNLDEDAHKWLEKANLGFKISEYRILDHTLLMKFSDCHEWRKHIRTWSLEKHLKVLARRKKAEEAYDKASQKLELTTQSMQQWFDAYKIKVGFDNIAYPISEILTGLLHQQSKKNGIEEPILSDLIPAEIACQGGFSIEEFYTDIRYIQSVLKTNTIANQSIIKLKKQYQANNPRTQVIAHLEKTLIDELIRLGIYNQCRIAATFYRIQDKDFSLTFLEPWFQQSKKPWLRLLIESNKLTSNMPQPLSKNKKVYFPDNQELRAVIELTATSKKMHMDGHHSKAK